jgi:hypothetical protein
MKHRTLALACALTVSCTRFEEPCPAVEGVALDNGAASAWNGEESALTITGSSFQALPVNLSESPSAAVPEVWLEASPRVALAVVWVDESALAATLPLTDPLVAPGTYDVTVINPGGCADTLEAAVTVSDTPPPYLDDSLRVDAVTPPFGWADEATAVTISGEGFISTPQAWLDLDPDDGQSNFEDDTQLANVAWIDGGSLTAVVPAGLAVGGPYDLLVLNDDGGYNLLVDAFTVTADPPPDILTVLPQAGSTQEDTPVTIEGESFVDGATVVLIDSAGTETSASTSATSATTIDATVPSSSLSAGAYLVRVENPDGSYDDWAAFVVRNPSAKLGTAGAWAEAQSLLTARAGLGLVTATDSLGRGWLYAVGGEDAAGNVLASVELAGTDAFGTLGTWTDGVHPMNTPRAHAVIVAHDGWLWAIGGDGGSGALDTVERAAFLDGEAGVRPEITSAEGAEDGELAAGTWYYRVSAVMPDDDPWNPGGETLASDVAVVRLGSDLGSVALTWEGVEGATSYRVYRTDAANGAAGAEHRVAADLTDTTWTDQGEPPGTASWVPDGGLGEWVVLDEALPSPVAHAAGLIATDPDGEAYVYVVGGSADGDTPSGDVLALDPSGGWFTAGTLTTPRLDHGAAVAGPDEAQAMGEDSPTFLVALQGNDGSDVTEISEYAEILVGGTLSSFAELSRLDAGGQARLDAQGLVATGWIYVLGGGGDEDDAEASGRQSEVEGPELDLGSWSSTSSTGTLVVPRADFAIAPLRATLYAAGGRTDSESATTSVEQVVY